jgi:hypothetical protein
MPVGLNGAGNTPFEESDALSFALDEILKRLDSIERRLARLEAEAPARRPESEASNAADFGGAPPASGMPVKTTDHGIAHAREPGSSSVERPEPAQPAATPGSPVAASGPAAPRPGVAVGDEPRSYSATATAPATERLHPLSKERGSPDSPFPDLSMLEEKIERRKGPAQRLDVRAAIESHPRICTRIQQLWGSPECEGYINDLVIDTRGNRQGFPPDVMEELLYLGRLARALVILSVDGDLWDTFDQVGDRR